MQRHRNYAVVTAIVSLVLFFWVWFERQAKARLQRVMAVVQETSHLAEGRLALKSSSEPVEQTMYLGLATYRLAQQYQDLSLLRAASLITLHSLVEVSGHLRKALRIVGLEPTAAVAYSPNGKTLAVGGRDGFIRLLDAESYRQTGMLTCHQPSSESAWVISFNSDGSRLAAGYTKRDQGLGSGLVCIFDVQHSSILRKWSAKEPADIYSVAYGGEPGKEIVVFGGSDKVFRIWDITTGNIRELPHEAAVVGVAVSADGRKVASGGEDKIIRVWDLQNPSPQLVMQRRGHEAMIQHVMFSPSDASVVISAGDDGRIKVWDIGKGCVAQQSKEQPGTIFGFAISQDGQLLAGASADANVRLFRLKQDTPCNSPEQGGASTVRRPPEFDEDGVLSGHGGGVMAVAFNREDNRLASTGFDGSIRIWNPKTSGFWLAELQSKSEEGKASTLPAQVTSLAIGPNGNSIAAGDEEGNIHLWDRHNEQAEPELQAAARWRAHEKAVRSVAYLWIGKRLALVSAGEDGVIKRWDTVSKNVIGPDMATDAEPVRSIALSPDGKMLASGSSDGTIRLWDPTRGKLLRRLEKPKDALVDYELNTVGFSQDGRHLMVGANNKRLRVLFLDGSDRELSLSGHADAIKSISRSRSGSTWLLSAGQDGSLLEWHQAAVQQPEARDARKVDEFSFRMRSRNGKPVTSMDTSEDGRFILTGGKDGQVQLWDGVEHLLIGARFRGHENAKEMRAVALAPDGSFFVTTDGSKILVWPGPYHWADIVCKKLVLNMSDKKWREWVSPAIPYIEQCPGLPVAPDDPASDGK